MSNNETRVHPTLAPQPHSTAPNRTRLLRWLLAWTPRALIAAAVVLFLVPHLFSATIPTITPASFDHQAVELERTPRWRYGYVHQYHGAMLVKTARMADAPPFVTPTSDDEVAAVLGPEIHRRWPKAWAELALYLGLFGYARLIRRLRNGRWPDPSAMRIFSGSLAVFGFVTLALGPYLVAGYGEPLFSTRRGPAALISSSLVPTTGPIEPAITYTAIVQHIVAIPLFGSIPLAQALELRIGLRAAIWSMAAVFWSLAALVVPALAEAGIRLSLRLWPRRTSTP